MKKRTKKPHTKNAVAYQNKDIASKVLGDGLIGKSFSVYGRPDIQIVDVLPTNLPSIEANELRLDHLFRLADESLAIIDYESAFKPKKSCQIFELHCTRNQVNISCKTRFCNAKTESDRDLYRQC